VVVEIDNKNGDFGGFVTWPFRQFGNSGVDQEYVIGQVFLPTSPPSFHRHNSFLLALQSHVGFLAWIWISGYPIIYYATAGHVS
jgi:hypothetical protein